jgi:hypothetical protein
MALYRVNPLKARKQAESKVLVATTVALYLVPCDMSFRLYADVASLQREGRWCLPVSCSQSVLFGAAEPAELED